MSHEELSELIGGGLYLKLGVEKGTNKAHLLFYSARDNDWFVVVVDESTREAVTVLPASYHNRWKISDEAMREAYRMVMSLSSAAPRKRSVQASADSAIRTPVYKFSAVFLSERGRRTVNLGTFPADPYPTLEDAALDREVSNQLRAKIREKVRPGEKYHFLIGQEGKDGEPLMLRLPAFP